MLIWLSNYVSFSKLHKKPTFSIYNWCGVFSGFFSKNHRGESETPLKGGLFPIHPRIMPLFPISSHPLPNHKSAAVSVSLQLAWLLRLPRFDQPRKNKSKNSIHEGKFRFLRKQNISPFQCRESGSGASGKSGIYPTMQRFCTPEKFQTTFLKIY